MREKTLKRIITFHTTVEAIAFERYCMEHSVPGRLIPLPGEISAGCGMCWMVPLDLLAKEGKLKTEAIYLLTI